MAISKLPFNLLSNEVSIWLTSIEQHNKAKLAIELNDVAKLLRKDKTHPSATLTALIQLLPSILQTCNTIESSFLSKSEPQKYPLKVIRLCIQLLRNTALAACNTSEFDNLSETEKSLSIYIALQLIGHSQRLSAVFHEPPSSSLWKQTGQIYNLALQTKINQDEVKHSISQFKDQLSIESVLKRNILFNLFTPYRYSDKQIKELFSISNSLADTLDLNTPPSSSSINLFYWDSASNNTPNTINTTQPCQQVYISINTHKLLVTMQMDNFICNLDKELILRQIEHLSAYQSIIDTPIPSAPTISHLLTGFNNISEHLNKVSTLQKIQHLSTQVTSNEPLSIQSKQEKYDGLNAPPIVAYSSNNKNLLSNAKPVKTLQVSNEKYIIAETSFIECNIGDLALLCHHNLTNKIGVIRQVKITNASKTVHILIEEIQGVPTTQTKDNEFISVSSENTQYILFPAPCKQANGSKLKSTSGASYTIEALIDYSSFYSLYQVTVHLPL